ncbi:CorA family divalent cation transporter [Rhodococcus sp. KBW08]|uniref:CorA family divalent cation transporter n=1 Tax=Rhodococcus sp. KBW08 TaxID=2144188 RepID=UPI0021A9F28C|nr:CorA family divalent cation transporter [Rhodococcus sp. KBW08]
MAERIVEFDDVISSLVAATLARVNLQQDTDLRKITAWASVAAFVTAFAGIYGMNFQFMPELGWRYGYLLWWIIAVSLFTLFRRKRWL